MVGTEVLSLHGRRVGKRHRTFSFQALRDAGAPRRLSRGQGGTCGRARHCRLDDGEEFLELEHNAER